MPSKLTALLSLLVLTAAYLLFSPSPSRSLGQYRYWPNASNGPTVKQLVRQSEDEYQEALAQREELIRIYGPTKEDVVSFPTAPPGVVVGYTLWDFFTPAWRCPHRVRRVGTPGDGGKWVCGLDVLAKQKECVIYSFGINNESSFEAVVMSEAPNCQVWGYDFSVNSFGPEITRSPDLLSRSHFYPYALGAEDKPATATSPPTFSLQSLMKTNNHTFIDILKIDIEGAEFDSLASFIKSLSSSTEKILPIGQMQLELHPTPMYSGEYWSKFENFLSWWEDLEAWGLRPFFSEPNLVYANLIPGNVPGAPPPALSEYSFINIRGDHSVIA